MLSPLDFAGRKLRKSAFGIHLFVEGLASRATRPCPSKQVTLSLFATDGLLFEGFVDQRREEPYHVISESVRKGMHHPSGILNLVVKILRFESKRHDCIPVVLILQMWSSTQSFAASCGLFRSRQMLEAITPAQFKVDARSEIKSSRRLASSSIARLPLLTAI